MVRPHFSVSAVLAGLIAALSLSSAQAGPCEIRPGSGVQAYPCGVIAVGASTLQAASLGTLGGAKLKFQYPRLNAVALSVPGKSALDALKNSGLRLYPDRPVAAQVIDLGKGKPGGSTGSSSQSLPEGVRRIGGPGQTATVGIAIVDSGIDLANQDLHIGPASFDAYGGNGNDLNGHGTHVAGIVAAINNSIDVVGVVPGSTVYPVRVLDANGSGSDSDVIAGLQWVFDQRLTRNIQVVNMSLGRPGTLDDQPLLRQIISNLTAAGVAVVVAAGNEPRSEISQQIPAGYPEVLAIASSTATSGSSKCSRAGAVQADTASYFSTDGAGVAISAPGARSESISRACLLSSEGILSLKPGGGTVRMSGTSMAAPHVAGVVAAMRSRIPGLDVGSIRTCLKAHADRVGTAPLNSPTSSYSFDGVREGIGLLNTPCP